MWCRIPNNTQACRARRKATAQRPSLPAGQFRVLYADPPWEYGNLPNVVAADHYATMTIEEICTMNVRSIAAADSVLFLWVTAPMLNQVWPVIEAWGFSYGTHFVWDKMRGVAGSYVDVQHELLLICTWGSCVPDRLTPMIKSVQSIRKSGVHSQKPEQFNEIIERLYDGPYLELFARRRRAGWTSFGNDPALTCAMRRDGSTRIRRRRSNSSTRFRSHHIHLGTRHRDRCLAGYLRCLISGSGPASGRDPEDREDRHWHSAH
jgi:N6-adenosine-specific RNA methylase IME4